MKITKSETMKDVKNAIDAAINARSETKEQWATILANAKEKSNSVDLCEKLDFIRPSHYGGDANPHEAIKVIEHYGLGFHLGNALKYIMRAGKKQGEQEVKDLQKAYWYLGRYIEHLTKSYPPQ